MTVLVVAAACAGCTASSAPAQQRGGDRPGLGGSITVSAASSLGPAFESIVAEVKRQNPRAKVQLNLASSTALALQIEQGAPADVFASADPVAMGRLGVASHLAGRAEPFARNRMTIVTKPGNPRRIRSLADLRRAEVVAECVSTAPCGTYAAQALDRAGVELDEGSVTREPDAATTVGAVANGDADAGIVYLSDAVAAKSALARVPIPKVDNVIATYPIAVVAGTPHRKLATAFVEAVQSPRGQAVLRRFGFLPAR